jgi:hypothetical protein
LWRLVLGESDVAIPHSRALAAHISRKRGIAEMRQSERLIRELVQEAFGLILELRTHREAMQLLREAIAFMKMRTREPDTRAPWLLVAMKVVRLPRY